MSQRSPKKRTLNDATGGPLKWAKRAKLDDSEDDELPISQEIEMGLRRQEDNEQLLSQHVGKLFYVHTLIAPGPGHKCGVPAQWPGRVQLVMKNNLSYHRAVCATVPKQKASIEPLCGGNLLLSAYLSFGTYSIVALHVGK